MDINPVTSFLSRKAQEQVRHDQTPNYQPNSQQKTDEQKILQNQTGLQGTALAGLAPTNRGILVTGALRTALNPARITGQRIEQTQKNLMAVTGQTSTHQVGTAPIQTNPSQQVNQDENQSIVRQGQQIAPHITVRPAGAPQAARVAVQTAVRPAPQTTQQFLAQAATAQRFNQGQAGAGPRTLAETLRTLNLAMNRTTQSTAQRSAGLERIA